MIELFKGIKVDWLGKRKLFFSISMVMLLIGMISLVVKGSSTTAWISRAERWSA